MLINIEGAENGKNKYTYTLLDQYDKKRKWFNGRTTV